jgi:CRP-like cAMP-binding protein
LEEFGDGDNYFVKVRTLRAGDHFGELALINKQKRSLGIRVSSQQGCKLHRLDKDTFTRILGSID